MKVKERTSQYKKLEFGEFFKNVFWKPNTDISDDQIAKEVEAIRKAQDSSYLDKLEASVSVTSGKAKKGGKRRKQGLDIKTVNTENKQRHMTYERSQEEQER